MVFTKKIGRCLSGLALLLAGVGFVACASTDPAPPGDTAAAAAKDQASQAHRRQAVAEAFKAMQSSSKRSVTLYLDEDPDIVQTGDLVSICIRQTLDDGRVLYASRGQTCANVDDPFLTDDYVVGTKTNIPQLSPLLAGMKVGQTKSVVLQPEEVFGVYDPTKSKRLPRRRRVPQRITITADQYRKKSGKDPQVGATIAIFPYFQYRVTGRQAERVHLEADVRDGAVMREQFGSIEFKRIDQQVQLTLTPIIGSPFMLGHQKGVIRESDDTTFTVDLNHPLAGRTVHLQVKLAALTKASQIKRSDIRWMEDHDHAYARAEKRDQPLVLLLYADWCTWCKKMMQNTFTDPRIVHYSREFAWARLNTDILSDYFEYYEQKSFPTTLILAPDGKILTRIDGYRDASAFNRELKAVLHRMREPA